MMTEAQFLNRFQRQPNGEWACTKPIKIHGPSGPVMIEEEKASAQEHCSWDSISQWNLIRWRRSIACPILDPLRS